MSAARLQLRARMPAVQPKFAVYRVLAQPGRGFPRAYVGCVDIDLWGGGDPETAARARADVHMAGGKSGAAWLRCCVLLPVGGVVVLGEVYSSRTEAYVAELYWTLRVMREHGRFLTRGGPFCRVALPWPDVLLLCDLAQADLGAFRARRADVPPADLPRDVRLHIEGRCYVCCARDHSAADCAATLATLATTAAGGTLLCGCYTHRVFRCFHK